MSRLRAARRKASGLPVLQPDGAHRYCGELRKERLCAAVRAASRAGRRCRGIARGLAVGTQCENHYYHRYVTPMQIFAIAKGGVQAEGDVVGSSSDSESRVREAVSTALTGKVEVDALDLDGDLFDAGMTSHQTVQVMLAIEDEFDIEFPDDLLNRTTFTSIRSIVDALETIR